MSNSGVEPVDGIQAVVYLVGILFTAGSASVLTVLIKGRAEAKELAARAANIKARTPGEVDSVAIQGAETAVITLQAANETLLRTVISQQGQIDRQAAMIVTLEKQAEVYRSALQAAETALAEARRQQTNFEHQLAEYHRTGETPS